MIIYWMFAVAMVIIALIFLLRPFFLDMKQDEIERSALNVNITKERLAELEAELAQGTISQSEYEQTREELEQALLFDVEQEQDSSDAKKINVSAYNRYTRYGLLLIIPVFAVSSYFYLGQPELINGAKKQTTTAEGHTSGANGKDLPTVEEMVEKLAVKLKENPNNAEGWFMLARSYMSMKRYKEAVKALEKTNTLVPNDPTVMLRYADALTMLSGGRITGKPFDLIKRAVAIKPDDPTGLWLIGMGYEEQGEYKKAISYWSLLLPLLKDNKSIDRVNNLIRAAKNKAGISIADNSAQPIVTTKNKAMTSLKVKVSLDKSMLKNVSMDDVVFIFAKAINGPPMPLAVARKKVKDLPVEVTLDDTMAMIPSMKLSSFIKVKVSARVSKSGQPRAQPGDVESESKIVESKQKEIINLRINKKVP